MRGARYSIVNERIVEGNVLVLDEFDDLLRHTASHERAHRVDLRTIFKYMLETQIDKEKEVISYTHNLGSGTFQHRRFGAAVSALDNSAPDISAPGLFGARTFFLESLFCSYVVPVCSSLRSR